MEGLSQIQFVTRHYWELHGLRWFLWGLVVILAAFEDVGWISTSLFAYGILPLGAILFLLTIPYYRHLYGDVKPSYHHEQVRALRNANAVGVLLFMLSFVADKTFQPALFLIPFGFAFWLAARYLAVRPHRVHLMIIAGIVVALNLVRYIIAAHLDPVWSRNGFTCWILVGGALITVGICDHLMLSRTLNPLHQEQEAEAHA